MWSSTITFLDFEIDEKACCDKGLCVLSHPLATTNTHACVD